MYKIIAALFISFSFISGAFAQTSFGFRTGLSFSTFSGELEEGESYEFDSGFHIGLGFNRNFTDIWGVRAELVYSQKGGVIRYDGVSNILLRDRIERLLPYSGNQISNLSITNSHIDLPLMGFGRITNWLELSVGVAPSFLVTSRGTGDLNFTSEELVQDIDLSLEYNYLSDKAGDLGIDSETLTIIEERTRKELTIPSRPGAYYFQEEVNDNKYNIFSLDAVAGVSVFVNRGLFIGGKAQFGLLDVTNDSADFALSDKGTSQADKDVNVTYQVSVGFYF